LQTSALPLGYAAVLISKDLLTGFVILSGSKSPVFLKGHYSFHYIKKPFKQRPDKLPEARPKRQFA
jgi:hypothetical protein